MPLEYETIWFIKKLSLEWRSEFLNDILLKLFLSDIFCMIKVKKISFDFRLEFRTYLFVSHVSIHNSKSVLNLLFFTVKLLNDAPDLIKTVCVDKTTDKLNWDCVWNFVFILRSNIPITDRNHGSWSPINWIWILSVPISLRNRFLVKFYWTSPTTLKTIIHYSTLFA